MSFQEVKVGDVFIKSDAWDSFFTVEALLKFDGLPLHVRLNETGGNNRTVTLSVARLSDTRFWTKANKSAE